MNIIDLREYCLSLDGVTEKMPFGKFARRYESLLVFYVLDHMFCLTDIEDCTWVNIYSTPTETEELRQSFEAVGRPVNRAMKNWVSIEFGADMPDRRILELISEAHAKVKDKYSKKKRSANG